MVRHGRLLKLKVGMEWSFERLDRETGHNKNLRGARDYVSLSMGLVGRLHPQFSGRP
jgi:hypothetical protein